MVKPNGKQILQFTSYNTKLENYRIFGSQFRPWQSEFGQQTEIAL